MSIQYYYPKTSEERMELMEFVYKNTDSFILNTFGYLWESRGWWDKFPIQVSKSGSVITGLHAFTVDTKAPNTIKTYYIVTGKAFRKMGIAKALTYDMLNEFKNSGKNYYVNSEEGSGGVNFYKKMFRDFKMEINEFGTADYIFQAPILDILNNNLNDL